MDIAMAQTQLSNAWQSAASDKGRAIRTRALQIESAVKLVRDLSFANSLRSVSKTKTW